MSTSLQHKHIDLPSLKARDVSVTTEITDQYLEEQNAVVAGDLQELPEVCLRLCDDKLDGPARIPLTHFLQTHWPSVSS